MPQESDGDLSASDAAHDQERQSLVIFQSSRLEPVVPVELVALTFGMVQDGDAGGLEDRQIAIDRAPADSARLGEAARVGKAFRLEDHQELQQPGKRQAERWGTRLVLVRRAI